MRSVLGPFERFFAFLRKIIARFLRIKSGSLRDVSSSVSEQSEKREEVRAEPEVLVPPNTTTPIAIKPSTPSRSKLEMADAQKVVVKKLEQIKGANKKQDRAVALDPVQEIQTAVETATADIKETSSSSASAAAEWVESAASNVTSEASASVNDVSDAAVSASHAIADSTSSILKKDFNADSLLELPPLVALSKIELPDFSKRFTDFQDSIGKMVDDVEKWLEPIQKFNVSSFPLLQVPDYMKVDEKSANVSQ